MPGNTKQLKKDVDQKPAPQYFDPVLDEYGYLYGSNGAARHIIYGADGQPVTTSGNKLAVRATEIETMLTTIEGYIDGLEPAIGTPAADPAANTILARLKTLATLIGEVQAAPTANTLLARLKNLETKVDAIIADGLKLSGVVTVTATAAEIFAGATRLPGRRKMIIKNEDLVLRIRVGGLSLTQQNGFPIEPGAVLELDFDPTVDTPIYAISEGVAVSVAVMEY